MLQSGEIAESRFSLPFRTTNLLNKQTKNRVEGQMTFRLVEYFYECFGAVITVTTEYDFGFMHLFVFLSHRVGNDGGSHSFVIEKLCFFRFWSKKLARKGCQSLVFIPCSYCFCSSYFLSYVKISSFSFATSWS